MQTGTGPDRTRKMQSATHTWSGIPKLKSMASQVFEKNTGSVKDTSEKARKGVKNSKLKHVRLVADLFNAPISCPSTPPPATVNSKDTEDKPRQNARDELPRVKLAASTTDLNRKSLPPVRIVLPGVNAIANMRKQPGTETKELTDPQGQPDHRDAIHLRLPGLLRKLSTGRLNKRDSLPLPPPPVEAEISDSSSSSNSEQQKQSPIDVAAHKPLPAVDFRFSRSGASSVYSFDSAEQTWNMINSIMNTVSEDDVQKVRVSLESASAALPLKHASIVFPEGRTSLERCEESDAPKRGRVASTSSVHARVSVELSPANGFSPADLPPDTTKLSARISRAKSAASVFSIVIKPFKSSDGLPPLVTEDKLPLRVRKILHERRERACFEAGLDADDDEKEIAYHEDVAYVLEALHECDVFQGITDYDWNSEY